MSKFIELLKMIIEKFEDTAIVSMKNKVKYDFKNKILQVDGKLIKITKKEMLFIELMIKNSGEIVTNCMIQRSVWQEKFMSDSAIKNLIFRLRKKTETHFIETIQCIGYKLVR